MVYQIAYAIHLDKQSSAIEKELIAKNALDAKPIIEQISNDDDIVYIYNMDSCDQIDVSLCENGYLVRYLLRNGFYQKECDISEVCDILSKIDTSECDPVLLGMNSFE